MRELRRIDLTCPESQPVEDDHRRQCDVNETRLTNMARRIRQVFYEIRLVVTEDVRNNRVDHHYLKWDGGRDSCGYTYPCIWPTVVRHLVRVGAEPREYVVAQFQAHHLGNWPKPGNQHISPADLITEAATSIYRRSHIALAERSAGGPQTPPAAPQSGQCSTPQNGFYWGGLILNATQDSRTIRDSPLFRYCTAAEESLGDAMDQCHESALEEYVLRKTEFDQAWGEWIPRDLRLEGESFISWALSTADDANTTVVYPRAARFRPHATTHIVQTAHT